VLEHLKALDAREKRHQHQVRPRFAVAEALGGEVASLRQNACQAAMSLGTSGGPSGRTYHSVGADPVSPALLWIHRQVR
jgi:hypothetical protein